MRLLSRVYGVAYSNDECPGIKSIKNNYYFIKNNLFSWSAGPFPVEHNGELYIFAEIFEYFKCKGAIGYTKLTNNGFTKWKIIIRENYHLSFPNIFIKDGMYYMCPESNENSEIYLYRCESFPDKWVKDRVIVNNGKYCDTVFTTVDDRNTYGMTYELGKGLRVFNVEDGIFSNGNIIVSSKDDCRPAGKILSSGEKRIIVAQIGKPLYGSGLVFKEFTLKWPDYHEKELFRVLPKDINCDVKRKYNGVHTFNVSKNFSVIDLIWFQFNPIEKLSKMIKKIRLKIC